MSSSVSSLCCLVTLFDLWWENHHDYPIKANDLHDDVRHAADPQGRGRQYLAAYLERLAGTRLGGFMLTRQASPGKWGPRPTRSKGPAPMPPMTPMRLVTSSKKKTELKTTQTHAAISLAKTSQRRTKP